MKVLCTICARGGSKGVKNKNIRLINSKPLIAYTIEQAKESKLFEHVVISTDSDEIADISKKYGAEVFFKRDARMASDTAGKLEVIRDAFMRSEEHYKEQFDYLIDLDATAPLRSVKDIIDSFKQFLDNNNDNLITAMPSRRSPYFNLIEQDDTGRIFVSKKLQNSILRRQDSPKTYDMNASIYIWKRDTILHKESVFLEKTGLYVMPEERSIDIDSELDFKFVEFIMGQNSAKR
ncbi:MAG: flagellar modification protein B [Sulfurimonas sp. RIFOXYD12_FULL_33_39]|uniref:acylneuraminate cytidylyltransferase family protein n=1 Tax=unclassified Sulfurimonas TaxID=2623549 RepID=UPI0008B31E31|nr:MULTISPECIES: acylneuraminate cytidylyltransferase family protein [unclassified Sulfurimonas]OHE10287.1 MAG: flagellar modification protein B [Sulfurimonas sp. RIFOXYD12_FULL_33_39]OHE13136.1 MAG: flagellar modification protein B [Sulfurimonas sp. RIFOXYD2_FULL_34_21]DAB27736.1 MAG TPA: flagellar modification protein B [Sulfurimonas sp. UBA10385]